MNAKYVVGCPIYNQDWALDLWFASVRENLPPDETGLAFMIPPTEERVREIINDQAQDFAWLDTRRWDEPVGPDRLEVLARGRNQLMAQAHLARAEQYVAWDCHLVLPEGCVTDIITDRLPIASPWIWLNRHEPQVTRHVNDDGVWRNVQWQHPMRATAMRWDGSNKASAVHYPAEEWSIRTDRVWRADVVSGVQVMGPEVFSRFHYSPNTYGESISLCWALEQAGIPRYCYGQHIGVRLHGTETKELAMGWPGVLDLAEQIPLAAQDLDPRDPLDESLGFFPVKGKA